ncbi:hypothetical protein EMIHUDRAFT_232517 [Emiliania huxleyi CCMP1516]|uniref:Uncharacterized protein n=2 Tax=Emiliania huxleyi TaxID=2903 RepID=A0A0D3K4M6_EMIH1|nr:hypothetical protein EMIHUDRAFT_232517 [Emiliania huxleyi CCMP1516]EOD30711.1 hypothetical protein EMIHUDRAFT_232517 [Emiliania huxleyi CCMP1516]|eukprot:XP_005783140.1 hypothetical protein EMIHUDRAFT_232517 [Emiliania huxleyi CCMP1516]
MALQNQIRVGAQRCLGNPLPLPFASPMPSLPHSGASQIAPSIGQTVPSVGGSENFRGSAVARDPSVSSEAPKKKKAKPPPVPSASLAELLQFATPVEKCLLVIAALAALGTGACKSDVP